jgi:hypothetical protein
MEKLCQTKNTRRAAGERRRGGEAGSETETEIEIERERERDVRWETIEKQKGNERWWSDERTAPHWEHRGCSTCKS